mmetsp:Transcript_36962/g.119219  ORF Transcript_36962/g.119219 Transcript_36962/m.119219 type:complete len:195 (-) Transcript_36962:70-654(-)
MTWPSIQCCPMFACTQSPTWKRKDSTLHSMMPSFKASLSRLRPMNTKRHSLTSSSFHLNDGSRSPEKSMCTPWKTYFIEEPFTARTDALVAEQVAGFRPHELADPHLQLHVVELPLEAHAYGTYRAVMLMFTICVEEPRVHRHHTVQIEGSNVEKLRRLQLAIRRVDNLCMTVDAHDCLPDLGKCFLFHQVALV